MTTLLFLRHGYSIYNARGLFSGQADIPLDARGEAQARDAAEYILSHYTVDRIYSSDLCRAVATATPVAEALSLPVLTDPALRELDVGLWQGLPFATVMERYPESYALYKTNPGRGCPDGGESYSALIERSARATQRIAEENDGKTVLISTHGGFIRCLRCAWERVPLDEVKNVPHLPNASLSVGEFENGRGRFTEIGRCDYLSDNVTEFRIV